MTAYDGGLVTSLIGCHATWCGDRGVEGGQIVCVWVSGGTLGTLMVAVINEEGRVVRKGADEVKIDAS